MLSDDSFHSRYARAREIQAEGFVDELTDLADSATPENANAARLRVETRKWIVGKILSKKYGDKPAGINTSVIVHNHIPVERQKQLQERMKAATQR